MLDTSFNKAQVVLIALHKDKALVGTVEVKVGKINKKKRAVKVSASASIIVGGKVKKYTVNVVGFVVDGKGTGRATIKKPAVSWAVTVE